MDKYKVIVKIYRESLSMLIKEVSQNLFKKTCTASYGRNLLKKTCKAYLERFTKLTKLRFEYLQGWLE